MTMRAADAGFLLQALARGGVFELPPEQEPLLAWMRDAGLLRAAADPGHERARLAQLRAELAEIAERRARSAKSAPAELDARERALRGQVLDVSERLAETEGATEVRIVSGGGPYRGAALTAAVSGARFQITQKGRALLSDLAPRMVRVGGANLDTFVSEMQALRVAISWRADRAAQIHALLDPLATELGGARRSVAIGLSAVREEPVRIVRAFTTTFQSLRVREPRPPIFTPEQNASGAECLCLATRDLSVCEEPAAATWLADARRDLLTRHVPGLTEDALDAVLLLSTVPHAEHGARVELAAQLVRELRERDRSLSLPLALVALAGEREIAPHLAPTILGAERALAVEISNPAERLATAVLLTFVRGDLAGQLERWRTLRQYLARFAPDGMAIAAALLSWIALEPAETLDDLRLTAAEIQKHRLADGGAETMSLAIKLLVSIALLAAGNEGDHEERLALAPIVAPRAPQLGLHGALSALPLVTTALSAFHRPVLDAALEYERAHQSTHSSYVFGSGYSGGRSIGWG